MNCPNCGAYNHAQNFRCIRCGQVLPPADDVESGNAGQQDQTAADDERYSTPSWDEETRWQGETTGQAQEPWQRQAAPPHSQSQWPTPPPYAGPPRDVPNYLWQSIVVTLCCCWPAGIPAIVFAARVNSYLASGDITAAEEASNKARMWTLISLGAGAFAYIAFICIAVVSEMGSV